MSRENDRRIEELLTGAAEAGSCYVVSADDPDGIRRALSRRVAAGQVVSPARGLFADAQTWDGLKTGEKTLCLARGLQELHPDWVFCGPTAAVAYGVDVSHDLLDRVHLAVTPDARGSNQRLLRRHAVLPADPASRDIEVVGGLRVTAPGQTVSDCLRWADFAHGLGVVDSAIRIGVVGREELERYLEALPPHSRMRGHALRTLAWADPRSENGGESIARARMLLLGYVCPELQVEVPRVVEKGKPYRADYCWVRADGLVILGELDGDGKYVEEELMGGRDIDEVLSDENIRGSRFTLYDVSLMRFRFGATGKPSTFAAILDEYGVPKRGSELALPDGASMVPDWDSLRRNKVDDG